MCPEGVRAGITVNDRLHFGVGLNPNINWHPIWQVLLGCPCDVLGEAGDLGLAVKLGRHGDVHPVQLAILVLSLGGNPTQVREEALDLTLEVGEAITVGLTSTPR